MKKKGWMPKMNKTLIGKVVSNRMNKTIVVEIVYHKPHPRYKKIIKQTAKLFAHDEKELCEIGDVVKIQEHLPLSKNKSWILLEVIQKTG